MTLTKVSTGDRDIAVRDTGGDGTPILLAHGFALDSTMFEGQAALAPQYRVISWDARGHGETSAGVEAFDFWDLARDQLALMDALGLSQAVIGGNSQGGFIALRTALLAPERVLALLLIDTEAEPLDPGDAAAYAELFGAMEAQGPIPALGEPLARQMIAGRTGDELWVQDWANRWQRDGFPLGAPVDCLIGRDDVTPRLGEIDVPALVVRGENDNSIPAERQERMRAALLKATELHVIPGAGHSPPLTNPAEVNTLIASFVAGLPVASA